MDPQFRARFNSAFAARPELYRRYHDDLNRRVEGTLAFRVAETPVFLTRAFREASTDAAREITAQLCDPSRIARMAAAVPARYAAPNRSALPQILTLDFAVVLDAHGAPVPRLIELQGFPSLLAFEVMQRDAWASALAAIPGFDLDWSCWHSDLQRDAFLALARRVILGRHPPEEVVLVDLDPPTQKTQADFVATKTFFGIDAVSATDLTVRGKRLFRRAYDGAPRDVPVARIYNRLIMDELERKNVTLPFDLRDDLDVEWVPHPDWFFIWSKNSLAYLDHPAIPKTTIVADLSEIPKDIALHYVLKPLFSFAGGGVNVSPTAADIHRIPQAERGAWCVQEKVAYAPIVPTTDGAFAKVELRLMLLRPDDESEFTIAENLCRLSRGELLGVDFNQDLSWVGSSVGIWPRSGA